MKAKSSSKAPTCCWNSPCNWLTNWAPAWELSRRAEDDKEEAEEAAARAGEEDRGDRAEEEGAADAALGIHSWLTWT